jgi:DNA repair photolyase
MNRIREMRGGKDYDSDFATRMKGEGVWADLIRQRFEKASGRLGFSDLRGRFGRLDRSQFRRPLVVPQTQKRDAKGAGQLDLF